MLIKTGRTVKVVSGFMCLGLIIFGLPNLGNAETEQKTRLKEVVVKAKEEKKKTLSDVEGVKIYSGKKTSVVNVEEAPEIVNSNYRQALEKTPGLVVSEETTPLISIGARGLPPDRAQYIQVLKDGIPIHADIVGYPEAYYVPPLETVDHIDFVRGGGSLLYGPQPGGALNFVTKDPYEGPLSIVESNAYGSHDFYSNYTGLSGTQGPLGYYGYFHHRQSQGFRDNNSQYDVYYGGTKFKFENDPTSHWVMAVDSYNERHGEPGGLTRANFDAKSKAATRMNDHFELNRLAGSFSYNKELSDGVLLEAKAFGGTYERLSWRQRTSGSAFGVLPSGANASSNEILDQKFFSGGAETRFKKEYALLGSEENVLTGGVLFYHNTAPRKDKRGTSGDAEDGAIRKDADRYANYLSLFAENMFKFGKLSITPGVRLESIWQSVKEQLNLDKTTVPLVDESDFDFVPLFGLGTTYELTPSTEIYHNISQGYRPKTYVQAVPVGSGQVVNNDLEAGKSWQTDLGLRGQPTPYFFWDGSAFYMEFTDQIGTVGSSVENVGDARHFGAEFAAELDLIGLCDALKGTSHGEKIGSLNFFTNAMFLRAEFSEGPNEGKTPQYAPDYLTRAGVEYNYLDKAKIRLAGTFLDDHWGDDGNTANFFIPSYKVWDLTGEMNVYKDNVKLFAGINNVFNEHYFPRVTSVGIDPADGRNYYGGVKLIW
ncbi:MAG: hypothetical protein A2Z88_02090 [Omnitrophica WOR_2 bacterium GWA2_47_8]|nr:MAG: hypothetical protein A2Z88_02090 [Omnitrophica WOR_2 bacterium GWA2_47_8]